MKDNKIVQGAPLTRKDFAKTIPEFGIMPFWFVNGRMDYDEMEYQLREYKAKGIPGIYIHARFGTLENTGYLTDDWFDRLRFTVEKAREIGLQIWVYDEYNWPSGTAGKQVMAHDKNLTQRYLELVEVTVPGQYFTFMEGTDSRYNDLEESEPVYACAILEENLRNQKFEYVDLMPNIAFDKVISWEAPKGPWRQMYFVERQASWYADVLNEEATDMFLKLTHERYQQELEKTGGKIADSIHGFYTDEPAMHYFEVAKDNYIIPWSSCMFGIFQDHNGYSLLHHLPKLFYDFGGDTQQVRYDFWSALTKQYEKTFFKKIEDWCGDRDLFFTGHLLFEEWPRLHARTGGNLFKHLRHMHMTGVDHLYPRVGNREMPDEHVALKLAASAAHQNGSPRLLCESMGGAYWDCTMERMKWIADWEYVLGVNLFNPHGFHYSIEGERKRDWPPSMFYHHTWWPQYKQFNDYVSRMGYLLSGGHHVAKLALLYPMNTIWAQYTPQAANDVSKLILRDFEYMTDRLLRLHIDFDYIDEDTLDECTLEDGALTIRGERYECLLLPAMTHIKEKTLTHLEAFTKAGGKVIADGLLPVASIEGGDGDVHAFQARVEALFGAQPQQVLDTFHQGEAPFEILRRGNATFVRGEGFCLGDHLTELEQVVRERIDSEIFIDQDEVFYLHRVKDGEEFFFLVNPSHNALTTQVRIRGCWSLETWDLETGGIAPLYPLHDEDGFTCFTIELPRIGSCMLHLLPRQQEWVVDSNLTITGVSPDEVTGYARLDTAAEAVLATAQGTEKLCAPAQENPAPFVPASTWKIAASTPNALILNRWKVAFDAPEYTPAALDRPDFDFTGFMPFVMGCWELQLPTERRKKTYPVDLVYVTRFTCRYLPEDLQMMIDGFKCNHYELYLNGEQITETPVRSYLDAEITTVPLRGIRLGDNTLMVRMQVGAKNAGILDLLKLTGTFTVGEEDGAEVILPPTNTLTYGDWCKQGYPYLAAMVDYTQEVTLPAEMMGKELLFSADVGDDLFQVFINDELVGTRMWQPYTLDITEAVQSPTFTLTVRVVNTIANLLEAQRKPSGLNACSITAYPKYTLHKA